MAAHTFCLSRGRDVFARRGIKLGNVHPVVDHWFCTRCSRRSLSRMLPVLYNLAPGIISQRTNHLIKTLTHQLHPWRKISAQPKAVDGNNQQCSEGKLQMLHELLSHVDLFSFLEKRSTSTRKRPDKWLLGILKWEFRLHLLEQGFRNGKVEAVWRNIHPSRDLI